MKQFLQNLREQRWLMLLVLLGWLLPQQAVADDSYDKFTDLSIMYNVYVSGTNTVTLTVCLSCEGLNKCSRLSEFDVRQFENHRKAELRDRDDRAGSA